MLLETWVFSKGHSDKVSDGNEEHIIRNDRKCHPVIKWQRAWLNFVHVLVFCGR